MTKRALADVLWEAACNLNPVRQMFGDNQFTCVEVARAELQLTADYLMQHPQVDASKAVEFMRELGCTRNAGDVWGDVARSTQVQGVRFMWLLLAACVAEDEGIEI